MLTGKAVSHPHDELLCLGAAWRQFISQLRPDTPPQKSADQENLPGLKAQQRRQIASLGNIPCCQG